MSKHRLFNSSQESLNLNSSRDEANIGAPTSKNKGKENTNKYSTCVDPRSEKNSNSTVKPHSFPKPVGTEVGNDKIQCVDSNENVNQFHPRAGPACVSDSDSMDEDDFFSRGNSNVKLPYTLQEDEFILKYILKGQNIFRASSVSLWKILESKKDNPKRTYQSLKNRFLKSIKPRLFTTYSYLIKDKETENIILEKYPDLKKRSVRKDVFSVLNMAKRPNIMDFSDDDSNPSAPVLPSTARNSSDQNQNNKAVNEINKRKPEKQKTTDCTTQNKNIVSDNEIIHSREVALRKGSTLVTVKFSKSLSRKPSSPPVGIYSKFLALKNQNKLVPCPTCSKLGYKINEAEKKSEESDSDSWNDNFIPNSVENDESKSRTPSGSNRVRGSSTPKEVEKSLNSTNSRKSKSNSKIFKKTPKNPKNSIPRNTQNSPKVNDTKAIPANSNSSNLQSNITSKELKQLFEDSYSRNILNKILSKDFPATKKRKTNPKSQSSNKSPQRTSDVSQQQIGSGLLTPPSRNLRKSVRKRAVKKVSNDLKVSATKKQPGRNLEIAKPNTSTTIATAKDSGSKLSGRPYLARRVKKSINYSRQFKKPKKRMNVYNLPLRISTLTHRERFILRKVLRRTYRIYRRNLLESNKKGSKSVKKKLEKKKINTEQKKTNLQTQSESDSFNDNYLRSLYKETVSECRKVVNSDEEERNPDQNKVRNNSIRQNSGSNLNDEVLKSFFMESESHSDTELTNSFTQNTKSSFNDTASSSLADNMMKMLSRF